MRLRTMAPSDTLPHGVPVTLSRLRSAAVDRERDEAWSAFIGAHSRVVLQACLAVSDDRDRAMDAYAFVLEALREDECRRLRAYAPDGKTKFTTWLVVVVQRLARDCHRQRYGRLRSKAEDRRVDHAARRNLENLVADQLDPDRLEDAGADSPDAGVRRRQLAETLRRSIAELPPSDQFLLALRFIDGRSVRDIRRTLALPSVFHVYRRLSAALRVLRRKLAERGVTESQP